MLAFHSSQDGQQGGKPMKPIKRLWAKLCIVSALAALGGCNPAAWLEMSETPDTAAETERDEIQSILDEAKRGDYRGELESEFKLYMQACAGETPNVAFAIQVANDQLAQDPTEWLRALMEIVKEGCPEYSQEFAEILEAMIELNDE